MTHLFVPTNFIEMDELFNSEFFSSSKITYGQLTIIMTFCRLLFIF